MSSDLVAGLKADDYDREYSNRYLLARIYHRYLREDRLTMLAAAGLAVCASVLMSAVPIVVAEVINRIGDGGGTLSWELSAVVLASAVLAWGCNWGRHLLSAKLVGGVVYRLQRDSAEAALDKDVAFYDREPVGAVLSRVTGDTEGFSQVMALTLNFLSQLFLVGLLLGLVFWIDVGLGLIVLGLAPVLVGTALLFRRVARVAAQRTRRVMARVNANIHESMLGIAVAKSFGQERRVYGDFDEVNRLSHQVYVRQGLIYSVILPILTLLSGLGSALLVYTGGRFVVLGDLAPGDWYFGLHALTMLWLPLTQAASFWSLFQQGLASSERVFSLIDSDDAIAQTGVEAVGNLRGEVEFRDVVFAYDTGERVFDGLSLRIAPHETVAVVGHTGAGKSSLVKLLARSYEFQGGHVLIDGRDVRSLDLASFRRQLGIVPQHPYIFSGTLADNIAYAHPDAGRDDVERAIDLLGKDVWDRTMSLSLDDDVRGAGHGLSAGQRQMVAVARVFLKQPAIVILDEPTASVDPLTEAGIHQALSKLFAERTVVVIAHRLSTIRAVDRLVVLDRGRLVEEGGFDELLERGGHFTQVYKAYYAHQRAD